jgi:hypothetical protein
LIGWRVKPLGEREGVKPDLNHTNWGNGTENSDHSD